LIFGKQVQASLASSTVDQTPKYWGAIWSRMRKRQSVRWALRLLWVFCFITLFADFLANEKPIYCQVDGQSYWPVLRSYVVELGWANWPAALPQGNWSQLEADFSIQALIPYSAHNLDLSNQSVSPFDDQQVRSLKYRHWMGTDPLGQDILAGMIIGTRIALVVGFLSMLIAALVGGFLGGIAGFYGDKRLQLNGLSILIILLGFLLGIFYGFIATETVSWTSILFFGLWLGGGFGLTLFTEQLEFLPKIYIPIDLLVMRLLEIFTSIPTLLLLLGALSIIEQPSIYYVIACIGLLSWPRVARFTRGELLRIRNLNYIEAARAQGYSDWHILRKHALPNALTPVIIVLAFGMAGAVLAEAALSFLGIGVPSDTITWGTLLAKARDNMSWWLTLFPGLAIFSLVTIFNMIGEGLNNALRGER